MKKILFQKVSFVMELQVLCMKLNFDHDTVKKWNNWRLHVSTYGDGDYNNNKFSLKLSVTSMSLLLQNSFHLDDVECQVSY